MHRRFLIVNAIALIVVGFAAHAVAQEYTTDEKRHFTERPYKTAEPGMLTPAAYVELAKKAVKKWDGDVAFREFQDGVVFRRFYRDAPAEDRDIVGVAFVYAGDISGGGMVGGGFVYMRDAKRPVIMVLMRKNLSKIYVNVAHLKERQ
jgi:hypothetical protein